jgi:hypothetical protein
MKKNRAFGLVASLGLAALAGASAVMLFAAENQPQPAAGASADQPAAKTESKPALKIEALAFMSGAWSGSLEGDGTSKLDEMWTEPAGGTMAGTFRWVTGKGRVFIVEVLTLTQDEAGVRMRLRHFTPTLEEMPSTKAEPISVTLTDVSGRKAVFTKAPGDAGDLQKITYDASADNGSTLRITVEFVQTEAKAGEAPKPPRKPLVLVMKKAGAPASPAADAGTSAGQKPK